MTDEVTRRYVFVVGCLGSRLAFLIADRKLPALRPILAAAAATFAIGFISIFLTRSRQTGPEVGGGEIWWDSLRPLHALLWGMYATKTLSGSTDAWIFLALDVALGAAATLSRQLSN